MNYTYGKNAQGRPKQKTLALGSYPIVTLREAREARDAAKRHLHDGRDPAFERKVARQSAQAESETTFETVARKWHALRTGTWSKVHADDVIRSLERDAFPAIGSYAIRRVTAPVLLEVLKPIEQRGAIETAHRLCQRASHIMTYAIVTGVAETNPAAGLISALKPKPRGKAQPAITDLDELREMLGKCDEIAARASTKFALRLLALTAVRPSELRLARWCEFELDGPEPLWRIPAGRMKGDLDRKHNADGDHLVPLASQAVDVLKSLYRLTGDLPVMFPGDRYTHRPISENTLRALLIRAGYYQRHVPHGFRAAYSTIMNELALANDRPGDRAVIDLMLAHVPTNRVESAYNRAAFSGRRRELAQEWADLITRDLVLPEALLGKPMR